MKLTDKELEVMRVIWNSKRPLCVPEIITASKNRTWRLSSIYNIVRSLSAKKVVEIIHDKPTTTNTAKFVRPIISIDEYVTMQVLDLSPDDIESVFHAIVKNEKYSKSAKNILSRVIDSLD